MGRILRRLSAFCVVVLRKADRPSPDTIGSQTPRKRQTDQAVGLDGDVEEIHSPGRRALQSTITVLEVVFSVAEAVPVLGPSLKGALEALSKVLKLVEQRFDNSDSVSKLTERLRTLVEMLSSCEAPGPLVERLIMQLGKIELELHRLLAQQGIRYATVSQYLSDCTHEINACVIDFTALTQMRILESTRLQERERVARAFVTVMDPFGAPQKVMRIDMTSLEVVKSVIVNRYNFNPFLQATLMKFTNSRLYEFTMDDGCRIETLAQGMLTSLDKDAVVVMNAVLPEQVHNLDRVQCPSCLCTIATGSDSRTICTNCDRRVSAVVDRSRWAYANASIGLRQARPNLSLLRNVTIRVGLLVESRVRNLTPPERDYVQILHNHVPVYAFEEVSRVGPPHNAVFTVQLKVKGHEVATAMSSRRNEAKARAAYKYLRETVEWIPEDWYME